MRILVLGGYGFIGSEVARALGAAGHEVVGLGRDVAFGRRLLPMIGWIAADLADLTTAEAWAPHLAGIEAVVNASGALQDGARDNVVAAQQNAIEALIAACEAQSLRHFVQISAPGAAPDAQTAFLRTKGLADRALMCSALDWTVLKPGLVIGPNAYGGTALLRMLAGLPFAEILVLADREIQTVASRDVADVVVMAIAGNMPKRSSFDLVAPEVHTLRAIVRRFRAWLGLPPARWVLALPEWIGFGVAAFADLAGRFGWRSPLRSTALSVLAAHVRGDGAAFERATGRSLLSLDETLTAMPSTRQERVFAKAQLVFPALVVTLVAFWLLSGLIGLWQWRTAAAMIPGTLPGPAGVAAIVAGSLVDLAIGIGFLVRRWFRSAALASIAVSLLYLAGGTLLKPDLWADPLGPLVKILPAIALALAALALSDER